MFRSVNQLALLLSLSTLLLAAGCDGPNKRYEVTGEVIFMNQPLDEGIIDFEPLENPGTKSGANIINGQYKIPKDKGLLPGKYKVTIVAGDGMSGGGTASPDAPKRPLPPGAKPGVERIPPEYNVKSNVVREVTPEGPNRFDFKIP